MSQADIDAFVMPAYYGTLAPEDVTTAVARGVSVNGRHIGPGTTVLHWAVFRQRGKVVVALLAAGADANFTNQYRQTSMLWGAEHSTADILQLLIDGGGNANESCNYGETPLIALVKYKRGDAAARLQVLLACPALDLDATYHGKTAEEWAVHGHFELAAAIAEERRRRERWSALRVSWIAATVAPILCREKNGCRVGSKVGRQSSGADCNVTVPLSPPPPSLPDFRLKYRIIRSLHTQG